MTDLNEGLLLLLSTHFRLSLKKKLVTSDLIVFVVIN